MMHFMMQISMLIALGQLDRSCLHHCAARARAMRFPAALLCAAIAGALRPAPRSVRVPATACALAPRDVLEAQYAQLADGGRVAVAACSGAPAIAELVADGDLEPAEVEAMGAAHADAAATLDVDGFVRLCLDIDDLFEDDDDDEEAVVVPAYPRGKGAEKPAAPAPAAAATPKTPEPPKKQLSPREALVEALPARCAYPDEESGETYDTSLVGKIEAVAALRDETARTDGELVDMLCGRPWTLRFTSSPSFAFNKGFTGVAGTLPGGAEFEGLTQSVEYGEGANTATYVEVVLPKVALPGQAAAPLDVNVQADWGLKRRFDALARKDQVYLDAVGRSVKYGPVSVDGQRVTRGWKAMRVMNSLAVEYIDDDLRVMKGTTAWFVFTR